jgi:hypothetical protein
MKYLRGLSATLGVLGLALWLAPMAFAQSTDLYPAGDSVSASSFPVTMSSPTTGSMTCTFNLGAFTLPAKGNSSGPVTATFTTRPTFTACSPGWQIETSGTWTLNVQYGSAAATITIPASGFTVKQIGIVNAAGPWNLTGVWNNGFSSPVSVASSYALYQSKNTYFLEGKNQEFTFGSGFSTLTDTTHPGSLLLLGP